MKVRWQAEDGYAGGSRPHTVTIPDDEFEDDMDEEQRQDVIESWVQGDFDNKVSWSIIEVIV